MRHATEGVPYRKTAGDSVEPLNLRTASRVILWTERFGTSPVGFRVHSTGIRHVEILFGIGLGLGLSAACGFRVFVPMFVMSIAARVGQLDLAEGFAWMATWPAIIAFGTATTLETIAFYVPWVDNLLDTAATPAAVVAGIVATAACVVDADPLLQWSAAIIGGGGVAGTVQSSSVAVRAASTLTTGGLGNFAVSTAEWISSIVMSLAALLAPIVAGLVAVTLTCGALFIVLRTWGRPSRATEA